MWWSLMAEKPTLIPYRQKAGPPIPVFKVLILWLQSPVSGPVFPSLHLPTVSRGALFLSVLPSLWPPPPPSHTHTLQAYWNLLDCSIPVPLPSPSLESSCLTSYPFPYLCLLIHPSQSQFKCLLRMTVPPCCSTYNYYYKNWPRGWKRTWEILFSVQRFLNFPVK